MRRRKVPGVIGAAVEFMILYPAEAGPLYVGSGSWALASSEIITACRRGQWIAVPSWAGLNGVCCWNCVSLAAVVSPEALENHSSQLFRVDTLMSGSAT